jgi:hypothetical protein
VTQIIVTLRSCDKLRPMLRPHGLAWILALTSLSACSLFAVTPPRRELPDAACTSTYTVPVLDVVVATVAAAVSAYFISALVEAQSGRGDGIACGLSASSAVGAVVLFAPPALVYGGSAIWGFSAVAHCVDFNAQRVDEPGGPASARAQR